MDWSGREENGGVGGKEEEVILGGGLAVDGPRFYLSIRNIGAYMKYSH